MLCLSLCKGLFFPAGPFWKAYMGNVDKHGRTQCSGSSVQLSPALICLPLCAAHRSSRCCFGLEISNGEK